MTKITLDAENCWIIRSMRPNEKTLYYEAQNIWNVSPAHATIWRDYGSAENDLANSRKATGRALPGEIIEVVPLYGALLSGGTSVDVKR